MNSEVLDSVRQWLAKANSDLKAVEILTEDEDSPPLIVCFHCQQYVEKLLKALLTLRKIEAPKTHDLRRLCELAIMEAPDLGGLMKSASALTVHAVHSRYPGDWPEVTKAEMQEMLDIVEKFAAVLLPTLREFLPRQER